MSIQKKYMCDYCGERFDKPVKKRGRFGGIMEVCPKCGHKFSKIKSP